MFENEFLESTLLKATKGNVANLVMIFALINGYLNGSISESDFLNDIKVITSTKE